MNYFGSNRRNRKYTDPLALKPEVWRSIAYILLFMLIVALIGSANERRWSRQVVTPLPNSIAFAAVEPPPTRDQIIEDRCNKYETTKWRQLRCITLIHYLLLRESAYGNTKACGDGGKACGPLQFHAPTYTANRARMMKLSLVDHMGDRYDMEDSIETTAWMISIGQEKQWGPVLRGEIKL